MVVVFNSTETNYLLFSLFCGPFLVFICGITFFGCAFVAFSALQEKRLRLSQNHSPYSSRRPLGQIIFRQSIL